jgi:hypothetical protein
LLSFFRNASNIKLAYKQDRRTCHYSEAELATHTHTDLFHLSKVSATPRKDRIPVPPQDLYSAELQQLQTRLAEYERGEAGESTAVAAVQRELRATAERLAALEGANRRLSATLEEESGLRAQVVAQLAAQRKETAATRSELETLKLSQKFLVRQPRGGARIPAEKMDLMNMVNHLLHEVRAGGRACCDTAVDRLENQPQQ